MVAADANTLRGQYPDIRIVGDFDGRLSHKDDRVLLLDGQGLPADEVHYYEPGLLARLCGRRRLQPGS